MKQCVECHKAGKRRMMLCDKPTCLDTDTWRCPEGHVLNGPAANVEPEIPPKILVAAKAVMVDVETLIDAKKLGTNQQIKEARTELVDSLAGLSRAILEEIVLKALTTEMVREIIENNRDAMMKRHGL